MWYFPDREDDTIEGIRYEKEKSYTEQDESNREYRNEIGYVSGWEPMPSSMFVI